MKHFRLLNKIAFTKLLLILILIQLFSSLYIVPVKVYADSYSPEARAKAWNAGLALSNCSNDAGWVGEQTGADINKGGIFISYSTDLTDWNGDVKTVGYITEPTDGIIKCGDKSDTLTLFNAIGEKPLDFLKSLGIYEINSDKNAYNVKLGSGDAGDKARGSAIKKAVQAKFGFDYTKDMPKDMQYAALYATFAKKCTSSKDTSGIEVRIIDIEGVETKEYYELTGGKNDVTEVGYSLDGDGGDGGGDQKMACQTIVKQMNIMADEYKKVVSANATDDDPSNDSVTPSIIENDTASCEAQGGALSWILCPVINIVGGALNWVDSQLSRLLEIDRDKYTSPEMYTAWSRFRNIALIVLIAAMLVMVISTAIGASFLDAYTVKKALPRMIMSVMFILLSWYICIFLIDFFNIIGKGTLGIMTSPFGGKASSLTTLFAPSGGGAVFQIASVPITIAAVGFIPGLFGIILSFLGTALLVMGIAFLVLIARQMFIIVLILFSPLAILSWIFPNNNKLWKFWWESFSKLLLMFPMVMAVIAAGRIFASVISVTPAAGAEGGLLNPLLKLVAYIIPYAFIPFTFKAAGGIFGNLVGMANDRSKGAFDRLRKGRSKSYGELKHRAKSGDLIQSRSINGREYGSGKLMKGLNHGAAGALSGARGHFGVGERGKAFHDIHAREAFEEEIKNNAMLRQLAYDDNGIAVMALSGGTAAGAERISHQLAHANGWTEGQRLAALNSAQAVGVNKNTAGAALNLMAQNKSRALVGSLSGDAGMDLVRQSATEISGGNTQMTDNLMGGFAFHSRNAGRIDHGGERANRSLLDGWARTGVQQHAQSFGASMQAFADDIEPRLATGTQTERNEAAIALLEMQNMLPNATDDNARIINETLRRAGIDHDLQETVMTLDPTTNTMVPVQDPVLSGADADGKPIYTMQDRKQRVSVEEQLSRLSGGAMSATALSGKARVYGGQQVPIDQRGGPPTPTPPPTPGGPTP